MELHGLTQWNSMELMEFHGTPWIPWNSMVENTSPKKRLVGENIIPKMIFGGKHHPKRLPGEGIIQKRFHGIHESMGEGCAKSSCCQGIPLGPSCPSRRVPESCRRGATA